MSSWVVSHCGSRGDYQIPLALWQSIAPVTFVTDVLRSWAPLPRRASPPYRRIRQVRLATALSRLAPTAAGDQFLQDALGRRAARAARAERAHVLTTSYYGWSTFGRLPESSRRAFIQLHPDPKYLVSRYRRLMEADDRFAPLADEFELRVSSGSPRTRAWFDEAYQADVIIAQCAYTAHTLECSGHPGKKIQVIPWGVDTDVFRPGSERRSGRLCALFIGSHVARKGIHILLAAWEKLRLPGASLLLVGRGHVDRGLDGRLPAGVRRLGAVSRPALVAALNRAHVMILPSIAEGFGHVYLESLAAGCPIVGTPYSAAPDLVHEGVQGFIAEPTVEALCQRLEWCSTHLPELELMRAAARARALEFTWDNFRTRLRQVLELPPAASASHSAA